MIASKANVQLDYSSADLHDIANILTKGKPPKLIEYQKSGKFYNVVNREWEVTYA
jgi:hypothetical protein